jgi:DNA (cytosine-5)-methyltransferase 1
LFSNIGVAEARFAERGIHVAVANEFVKRRADFYQTVYPKSRMICGDISSDSTKDKIIQACLEEGVDVVMATPPCQGMSTAGEQLEFDPRNSLVLHALEIVNAIHPKYVFFENVPQFLQTSIVYHDGISFIPDVIKREIGGEYHLEIYKVNMADYGIPQIRERAIILCTRKDQEYRWKLPKRVAKRVTLRDCIGDLPSVDPFVKDVPEKELLNLFPHYYERRKAALSISPWHIPPVHVKRQVICMMHTPTGKSAFENPKEFLPKKANGEPVKGFKNTYKRQNWDTPAYTVTMDNRKISSQDNVHPGRKYIADGVALYSDPRTLTLYEIMRVMTIPDNWPIPANTSEAFLRRVIGEGIPSSFAEAVFVELQKGAGL